MVEGLNDAQANTSYIFDKCEVDGGENISGGTGHDTLVIPAPLAEMQALGLNVTGFEEIVVLPMSCYSECRVPSAATRTTPDGVATMQERNFRCDPAGYLHRKGEQLDCAVLSEGSDAISTSQLGGENRNILYAQGGDDVIRNNRRETLVLAGDGMDLLCSGPGLRTMLHGGSGNDSIQSQSDEAEIVPGPGADEVIVVAGQANIILHHQCEAESGESYIVYGGSAKLYSPLDRTALEQLGVQIDEDVEIVLTEGDACSSYCSGAPVCEEDEQCLNLETGPTCVPSQTTFELSEPVDERYDELPAELRDALRAWVDEISGKGAYVVAPYLLRKEAAFIEPVLVASIDLDNETVRAAEIGALASLYTDSALGELERIALKVAPPQVGHRSHLDFGGEWYEG